MPAPRPSAGVAILAAVLLLAGCASAPESTPTPTDDSRVDAVDLAVGMCILDGSSSPTVTTVEVIDCGKPHDTEIFASLLLPDGPFPGAESVAKSATDLCAIQFANFVGVSFPNSALTYEYYAPSPETWNAGDREVLCLIRDPKGPTTGSLEGAAR